MPSKKNKTGTVPGKAKQVMATVVNKPKTNAPATSHSAKVVISSLMPNPEVEVSISSSSSSSSPSSSLSPSPSYSSSSSPSLTMAMPKVHSHDDTMHVKPPLCGF